MQQQNRLPLIVDGHTYWKQIGCICSANLLLEDRFNARFLNLTFDLEGYSQGFMGPIICREHVDDEFISLLSSGRDWINRVKAITGARTVAEMKGKIVWVVYETEYTTGTCETIRGLASLNLDKGVEPLILSIWGESWKNKD